MKLLYGTAWKESDTQRCVEDALENGFRAIDTANQRKHYFEAAVGEALKKTFSQGKLTRKDIFLQTKFTSIHGQDERLPYDPEGSPSQQVKQSFASSLEHLQTDFIDSYVLHGPSSFRGLTDEDWGVWAAMEELFHEGLVKSLGVSNVNIGQLQLLYQNAKVKPKFVQNRCFALTRWDKEIRTFCSENQITYQGFSLLTANYQIFQNPRFKEVVASNGCTPAQAVFRFAQQVGMLPLTGTTNAEHMREDLDCVQFELSPRDIETMEGLCR